MPFASAEKRKQWREQNAERLREAARLRMAKLRADNPDKYAAAQKEWKAANPEKVKEYKKRHYDLHKEEIADLRKNIRERKAKEEGRAYPKPPRTIKELAQRIEIYRQKKREYYARKWAVASDSDKAKERERARAHYYKTRDRHKERAATWERKAQNKLGTHANRMPELVELYRLVCTMKKQRTNHER